MRCFVLLGLGLGGRRRDGLGLGLGLVLWGFLAFFYSEDG